MKNEDLWLMSKDVFDGINGVKMVEKCWNCVWRGNVCSGRSKRTVRVDWGEPNYFCWGEKWKMWFWENEGFSRWKWRLNVEKGISEGRSFISTWKMSEIWVWWMSKVLESTLSFAKRWKFDGYDVKMVGKWWFFMKIDFSGFLTSHGKFVFPYPSWLSSLSVHY